MFPPLLQNPPRSSHRQTGASSHWCHNWFWVIPSLMEIKAQFLLLSGLTLNDKQQFEKQKQTNFICLEPLKQTRLSGVGFTFTEHLCLAHEFAFFLLHSAGCRVLEFHHVPSNWNALRNPVDMWKPLMCEPFDCRTKWITWKQLTLSAWMGRANLL